MEIIRIFMSFTGAFAFSLLFNIKGKRLFFASLGGLLCGFVFYFSSNFSHRDILCYFAASIDVYKRQVQDVWTVEFLSAIAVKWLPEWQWDAR